MIDIIFIDVFCPYQHGSVPPVRWFSSEGSGHGSGRGGFIRNFLDNLRKGLEKKEMQESLKGFHEEREKLEKSYVMQSAREKLISAKVGLQFGA